MKLYVFFAGLEAPNARDRADWQWLCSLWYVYKQTDGSVTICTLNLSNTKFF